MRVNHDAKGVRLGSHDRVWRHVGDEVPRFELRKGWESNFIRLDEVFVSL